MNDPLLRGKNYPSTVLLYQYYKPRRRGRSTSGATAIQCRDRIDKVPGVQQIRQAWCPQKLWKMVSVRRRHGVRPPISGACSLFACAGGYYSEWPLCGVFLRAGS